MLNTNSIIDWTDIENIYSRLNTQRQKFNFSTVTVPSLENQKITPNAVSNIKTIIENMKSNSFLSSINTNSITIPTTGELIRPLPFSNISSLITDMENTCAFTCSFFSGFSANDSSFFSGFSANDSSFFSGFSANNSSDFFANDGSFFSGFSANDSSDFSGWQTGFFGWQSGNHGH